MTDVHVVVPDGIDDPARPSGGNAYDRRICRGLAASGWTVHERPVPGAWPRPDANARAALTDVLAAVSDGTVVLLDGLIASAVPEVLIAAADRLRLVVLVHMPLGDAASDDLAADTRAREHAALSAAAAVVTTSRWTRARLLDLYTLTPALVHVAEPGVEPAELAPGTATGGALLCVAAVAPHKGHDVLVAALTTLVDLEWRCTCVGPLDRDPGFVDEVVHRANKGRIDDRVRFTGPLDLPHLDAAYAAADLLVLASRAETYGMVVAEGLAHGLPVVATGVGGVPEALGQASDGTPPGLLVPADDAVALAAALRRWLVEPALRQRLRFAAGQRRSTLPGWSTPTALISDVLADLATR